MPPICRNWQNAYINSLSKVLNALEGQTTLVASKEIVHQSKSTRQIGVILASLAPLSPDPVVGPHEISHALVAERGSVAADIVAAPVRSVYE